MRTNSPRRRALIDIEIESGHLISCHNPNRISHDFQRPPGFSAFSCGKGPGGAVEAHHRASWTCFHQPPGPLHWGRDGSNLLGVAKPRIFGWMPNSVCDVAGSTPAMAATQSCHVGMAKHLAVAGLDSFDDIARRTVIDRPLSVVPSTRRRGYCPVGQTTARWRRYRSRSPARHCR